MEPLKRALKPLKVWVTGLRAAQSVTRTDMPVVEYDANFDVIKVNPLINWSEEDVWDYIKTNNVPYNKLHDQAIQVLDVHPVHGQLKLAKILEVVDGGGKTLNTKSVGYTPNRFINFF